MVLDASLLNTQNYEVRLKVKWSKLLLYSHPQWHNDKDAGRKTHDKDAERTSLEKYSPLTLLQGFEKGCWRVACERMLETEHKLHILTPLLSPSRCVFLVLLDAQPEVLGSTPSGLFRGPPRSGVAFPSTSGLWLSGILLATASGVFRVPPRSGVAFPTTSGLYCLEFDWQLPWDSNSTELNNNSTPTRSPTRSLKSDV